MSRTKSNHSFQIKTDDKANITAYWCVSVNHLLADTLHNICQNQQMSDTAVAAWLLLLVATSFTRILSSA